MHDIKAIRENPEAFDAALTRRPSEQPRAAKLLALDDKRRAIATGLQEKLARRNAASKEIGKAKGKGGDPAKAEALMAEVAALKDDIAKGEAEEREAEKALRDALAEIPNLPAADVPDGADEHGNALVRKWGKPRDFEKDGFAPKQHFELGEAMGFMDFEAAAKMSGARFTVLKGGLARLERALGQFMLDLQTSKHGYTEVQPPLLVKDVAAYGTAQLPKFADDLFSTDPFLAQTLHHKITEERLEVLKLIDEIKSHAEYEEELDELRFFLPIFNRIVSNLPVEKKYLIPTSEVPLTNLVRESIVPEADLPHRYTALTPCFRAEAGAAGRDTRGMIRQHQFNKVELVSITAPEQSEEEHERMTRCAEEVLKRLGLPYRTMLLCTGDMGFASRKTYDIEVWLPGQNAYREISSCSNCGDFQARRMDSRYRPKGAKAKPEFVHTLNGSGLAVGRTLIAVMENYQQADGSIRVPDALRPYMGGVEQISR
jgi:seryl-tRNA synthetase